MSSEWQVFEIGELCSVGSSKRIFAHDYVESGIPFFASKDVIDKALGSFQTPNTFISEERFYEVSSKFGFPKKGDLLLSSVGNRAGISYVVQDEKQFYFKDGNITWFKGFKSLNSDFLCYWLKSDIGQDALTSIMIGSAQKALTISGLQKLKIKIPRLPQQKNIVSILKALDDRIALLRETNATLESIAQALFKSWFVDFDPVHAKQAGQAPTGMSDATAALFPNRFTESPLGLVPEGWWVERLGNVTQKITKGTTPTTLKRPFVESGINFIKAESMDGNGGFLPGKFAFIDAETHSLLGRSQLAEGDILVSIAGTIGRMAVMTKDYLPANTNQAVALIRPIPNIFPGGLIYRSLQRAESQQLMGECVVQAVQANLSLGSLSDMTAVIPPAETVNKLYEAALSPLDDAKFHNHQQIETLSTLRDTLLPRLISGQLRLPEAMELVDGM